jgi:hypothetical protein
MRRTFLAIAAMVGCGEPPTTTATSNVFGVVPTAISDRPAQAVLERMSEWNAPDAECSGNAYGGIELTGNVLGRDAPQTVLASYDHVLVLDRDGALIAEADTGLDCAGTADAIEAVAIGRTWLDAPVIEVAATAGGRAEQASYVMFFRVRDRELVPLFSGAVVVREPGETRTGSITFVPDGVVYRAPDASTTLWTLDRANGRYVRRGAPTFPRS